MQQKVAQQLVVLLALLQLRVGMAVNGERGLQPRDVDIGGEAIYMCEMLYKGGGTMVIEALFL